MSLDDLAENRLTTASQDTEQLDLKEISESGSLKGVPIRELTLPDIFPYKRYFPDIAKENLSDLYLKDPELAIEIATKRIVGAHGSASGSLLGVFKYGLKPQNYLDERNILVASGIHDFGSASINLEHVSFVVWFIRRSLNQAYAREGAIPQTESELLRRSKAFEEHASRFPTQDIRYKSFSTKARRDRELLDFLTKPNKSPLEQEQENLIRENFPVIYLINGDDLTEQNTETGFSDVSGEFAIKGGREKSQIPIVLVPQEKIEYVRGLALKNDFHPSFYPISDLTP